MGDTTKNNDGTASTEGTAPVTPVPGAPRTPGTPGAPGSASAQVEKTAPLGSPDGSEGKTPTGQGSGAPEDDQDSGADGDPKNKEAAKWRLKFREAETERDSLRGTVDSLRAELLAAKLPAGIKAKAVLSVVTMDELLTDGALDTSKIAEAVKTTCQELGIRRGGGSSSLDRADAEVATGGRHTWGEALSRG